MLRIGINARDFTRRLNGVSKALRAAQKDTLNDGLRNMKTNAARIIRTDVNLPVGRIKGTFTLRRATINTLSAELISTGRPVPLIHYGARPRRPASEGARLPRIGVSVLVKKAHGRKIIPGSFVARMKSGHAGVFRRKGRARLPIKQFYGPRVPDILSNKNVRERVLDEARAYMEKRWPHHANRHMQRAVGR